MKQPAHIPVLELNNDGTVKAINTFGPNGLISRRVGSATSFYAFDPLGNAANVISASGTVLYNCAYDAYGQPYGNATTLTYGYGAQYGYYRDSEASTADNLLLCTFRWYDPATARWLTRDPIGYAGGSNLYGYVGGNPVGGVDPWGLDRVSVGVGAGFYFCFGGHIDFKLNFDADTGDISCSLGGGVGMGIYASLGAAVERQPRGCVGRGWSTCQETMYGLGPIGAGQSWPVGGVPDSKDWGYGPSGLFGPKLQGGVACGWGAKYELPLGCAYGPTSLPPLASSRAPSKVLPVGASGATPGLCGRGPSERDLRCQR